MKIVITISARMASTRLPSKALLPGPTGRPLLATMIARTLTAAKRCGIAEVMVATTNALEDAAIGRVATEHGVDWFHPRCPPDDVLRRLVQLADHYRADALVRLTADCPLVDPVVIEHCVKVFDAWGRKDSDYPRADYVGTSDRFADGMDVDVVSAEVLAHALGSPLTSDHEHVIPPVERMVFDEPQKSLPTIWSGRYVEPEEVGFDPAWAALRLTLDEPADYRVIHAVMRELGSRCTMREIAALWQRAPWLFEPNEHLSRNEGYQRSVARERREPDGEP